MAQQPLQLRKVLHTTRLTLTLWDPESQEDYDTLLPIVIYLKASLIHKDGPVEDLYEEVRPDALKSMEFFRRYGRVDAELLGGRAPTTPALWIIRLGADSPQGESIGVASVLHRAYIPDQGWVVMPQHHGKGYATEASAEVLRYFREELNLSNLMVATSLANTKSKGVSLKLGYVAQTERLKVEDGTELDFLLLPGASLPPPGFHFSSHAKREEI